MIFTSNSYGQDFTAIHFVRFCSTQVVVLYVEQEESVRRQINRAFATTLHNQCAPISTPSFKSTFELPGTA